MKNKSKLAIFIIIIILTLLITACSKGSYPNDEALFGNRISSDSEADMPENPEESTLNRKIIYSVYTTLYTDNFNESVALIKDSLKGAEWTDYESISSNFARFVVRVKSDRIDEYINAISKNNDVQNYEKTARDISINYYDKVTRITALEAEQDRLIALYLEASVEDMIAINKRLSQIELEISNLQSALNQYDSLIDYSEITIYLYERSAAPSAISFGTKLNKIFIGAWKALGAFFGGIVIFITAAFPFIVVLGPIVIGIIFLVRFIKRKKNSKE